MTGSTVVNDLRSADVAAGGQGSPLLPIYHRALAELLEKPVAILNPGGVANITYIGEDRELTAFDTGMASALIDNWMQEEGNASFAAGVAVAAQGLLDEGVNSDARRVGYAGASPCHSWWSPYHQKP